MIFFCHLQTNTVKRGENVTARDIALVELTGLYLSLFHQGNQGKPGKRAPRKCVTVNEISPGARSSSIPGVGSEGTAGGSSINLISERLCPSSRSNLQSSRMAQRAAVRRSPSAVQLVSQGGSQPDTQKGQRAILAGLLKPLNRGHVSCAIAKVQLHAGASCTFICENVSITFVS